MVGTRALSLSRAPPKEGCTTRKWAAAVEEKEKGGKPRNNDAPNPDKPAAATPQRGSFLIPAPPHHERDHLAAGEDPHLPDPKRHFLLPPLYRPAACLCFLFFFSHTYKARQKDQCESLSPALPPSISAATRVQQRSGMRREQCRPARRGVVCVYRERASF
ncbi:hypothetical protein HPB48_023684 [Haemaphysalis longicornis]|uniref:Uncharacterized protein n=1 Tax=Haemaphysalis longicornis TaxID=44386 RepID=A0A9J6H7C6_HAELO|nr:hypothetical protein HPB48_023684 [Haemaphysalis longicornis]